MVGITARQSGRNEPESRWSARAVNAGFYGALGHEKKGLIKTMGFWCTTDEVFVCDFHIL